MEITKEIQILLAEVQLKREYKKTLVYFIKEATESATRIGDTKEDYFFAGYEHKRNSKHIENAFNMIDDLENEIDKQTEEIEQLLKKVQ